MVKRHMQFELVAALGDEMAKQHQDRAASEITPDQIADADRMAREWVAKHQQ
jgi:hypothetical protein